MPIKCLPLRPILSTFLLHGLNCKRCCALQAAVFVVIRVLSDRELGVFDGELLLFWVILLHALNSALESVSGCAWPARLLAILTPDTLL